MRQKAFQHGSEFISKLTSLKSPDEVMKLQVDYAKSAYEMFVAESKRFPNSTLTVSYTHLTLPTIYSV